MQISKRSRQWILVICLLPPLLFSGWCGYQVYETTAQRAAMKEDFSHANSILFGLFSANIWREQIKGILVTQIEEFAFTGEQDSIMRSEIDDVLYRLIDQARDKVEAGDGSFKGKMRKAAVKVFVDWDNLRSEVPSFTETILLEINDQGTKDNLKKIATQKVDEYAAKIHADTIELHLLRHYEIYGETTKEGFNAQIAAQADTLEEKSYRYTYYILGVIVIFLLPWFLTRKYPELKKPLFILSVAMALVVLVAGLVTPMIEIDARISKIDFVLMDQHVLFTDQILFYRSKSVLQVVDVLLQSARFDTQLVGFLVLAFSVILPVSKLISTGIKLLGKGKLANNKLINWLAFHSGKWSMADVLVVAVFMAYISFDGILDNQLKQLETDHPSVTSIATNATSLEPGFVLFMAYVLFGLILAQILKWLTTRTAVAK